MKKIVEDNGKHNFCTECAATPQNIQIQIFWTRIPVLQLTALQLTVHFFWIWTIWWGDYNWNWADFEELLLEHPISQNTI